MKRKVLLIEDNPQNRYLATFLLEARGYQVIPAQDGLEALALAADLQPDLVLLDIQLPQMDGYQVVQRLREIPRLLKVPILAVTSYAMPGDRDKALAAGFTGYLEKPINPETFVGDIEAHL